MTDAPKVVQILYSGLGGHGSVAFSLAERAVRNAAWSPCMIFFGIEPVLEEYQDRCRENAFPYRHIMTEGGKPHKSWTMLYQALSDLAPDAIILHSVKTVLPCAFYAWRHKIPLIAVEHQPNKLKKRSEWWTGRQLMRFADQVVTLTPEYQAELKEGLGRHFKPGKVSLIPNGIDTDFYTCRAKTRAPQRAVIGMAARFSSTKRQDVLVQALAELKVAYPETDWHLSLAGEGETLDAVQALVKRLDLSDHVEMPGFLRGAELRDWFCGLDIYVHASEGETQSTSLMQAMASRLPIIGADVEGIGNMLSQEGGCGQLVPELTASGFAQAIKDLHTQAEEADRLAENARAVAVARYSDEAMFQKYDDILRSCLNQR